MEIRTGVLKSLAWAVVAGCLSYDVVAAHHLQGYCNGSTDEQTRIFQGQIAAWLMSVGVLVGLLLQRQKAWTIAGLGLLGLAFFLFMAPFVALSSCGTADWVDDITMYVPFFGGSAFAAGAAIALIVRAARSAGGRMERGPNDLHIRQGRVLAGIATVVLLLVVLLFTLIALYAVIIQDARTLWPLLIVGVLAASVLIFITTHGTPRDKRA